MDRKKPTKQEILVFVRQWADEFFKASRPLSYNQSKALAQCMMAEIGGDEVPMALKNSFAFRMIEGRALYLGLKISPWLTASLSALSNSPGTAVMLVTALRVKGTEFDTASFADAFPVGIPDDEALNGLWDRQKGYSNGFDADNLLDYVSAELFKVEEPCEGGQS